MLETPSYLQTSVLNLLGHGAPLYIMSPDVSALTSLGPQGEMAILGKVTNVADFGGVVSHSPFAELDYFRASSNLFKLYFSGNPKHKKNKNKITTMIII